MADKQIVALFSAAIIPGIGLFYKGDKTAKT